MSIKRFDSLKRNAPQLKELGLYSIQLIEEDEYDDSDDEQNIIPANSILSKLTLSLERDECAWVFLTSLDINIFLNYVSTNLINLEHINISSFYFDRRRAKELVENQELPLLKIVNNCKKLINYDIDLCHVTFPIFESLNVNGCYMAKHFPLSDHTTFPKDDVQMFKTVADSKHKHSINMIRLEEIRQSHNLMNALNNFCNLRFIMIQGCKDNPPRLPLDTIIMNNCKKLAALHLDNCAVQIENPASINSSTIAAHQLIDLRLRNVMLLNDVIAAREQLAIFEFLSRFCPSLGCLSLTRNKFAYPPKCATNMYFPNHDFSMLKVQIHGHTHARLHNIKEGTVEWRKIHLKKSGWGRYFKEKVEEEVKNDDKKVGVLRITCKNAKDFFH